MKLSPTLRSLLMVLVIVAIAPLFCFSVLKSVWNADDDIAVANRQLESTAATVTVAQERIADSARQLLASMSKIPRLADSRVAECTAYFNSLKQELDVYSNIGIISASGKMLCHAFTVGVADDMSDRDYFQAAMARRSFVASGYLIGRVSKKPLIAFALPVLNSERQPTAVVFAALHFPELAKAYADVRIPAASQLFIMDRNGIVLADNSLESAAVGQFVASPALQQAVKSAKTGFFEGTDEAGIQKIYVLKRTHPESDSAFFVAVGLNRDTVTGPARKQLILELVVLLLVTGMGCVLAWLMGSRTIVKPALQVIEATQQIKAGRLDVRIPVAPDAANYELVRIATGFNQMAETIQQRETDLMLELSRSEQAWQALDLIVNSLQDGLIAVDANARILLINETASKIFSLGDGITPTSVLWPQRLGLFVPGSCELYATEDLPLYKALQGQSGGPQRVWVKNDHVPEGKLISVRYRPMADDQGQTGALMVFTDITELDKLQQEQAKNNLALRASQRQLLDAQRLGRIGHWQMDPVTRVISWSDQLCELFGLLPGTFDGRQETFLQLLHPADLERYLELLEQAIKDKKELEIEYRIVTPAGQIRWMHQLGQTHLDRCGQSGYRAGVVQEITARKESELSLARNTDLLRRTGKMASVGGWEMTFSPSQTYWTDELYRIHELEPDKALSARQSIRFFSKEAQAVLKKALRAAMKHCTPWDLELPLTTAKGRQIWVRTQGQTVYRDGRFIGLSGVMQDITAQHASQEQLRLLETCVSRLNDIVLITEAEPFNEHGPRIVFVNDAFERRTGYTRDEVLGKSTRFLQGPKTQRSELDRIDAALKKWQPVRAELIYYSKTGHEFWIELDIVPVANAQGWFTHWVTVQRDITQRKLAEQAMLDSEQRYAALFEQAPVPMWVYDTETFQFLTINCAAVRDYGYSVAEFLSMSIFDIRSDSEAERLKRFHEQESLDSSQRWEHRRKDGSVFTARGVSRPIKYAGKQARFAFSLDVTAQVEAENEVREYLSTLQRAAAAALAVTLHLSLDHLMDEVASQARGVIGAHQSVVSLCRDTDWANATHIFSSSDKYADVVAEGLPLSMGGADIYASACETSKAMRLTQAELELHPGWLDAAGFANQRPVMRGWMAVPLVGRNGKNIGLLQLSDKFKGEFTLQDEYVATELAQLASIVIENAQLLEEVNQLNTGLEQKVARRTASLARQEALFRAVAEQAPQVIWTVDPTGRVTYFNRAWFDLMGGELADWYGLKWSAAIHPEDLPKVQANWALTETSQTPFSGVRRLLTKDGSFHVMSYRASPVFDAHGKVDFWVGIDADVTEIKAIEGALRLSNQELEAFSYSVSHDLRSPLNTIDGFSRLLSKELGTEVSDKEKHFLSRIQAGVAQMGKLIEDLLSLAQVSRMQLQNEAVDLSAICQHTAEEWQARHPERKVAVQIENGLHAHGDGGLIRIVLENLLGNAWKFTSHVAHATICVGEKMDAAGLSVFFVSDNGAGFDMAYADKLFVAFQRLHLASEFPGTGIGLATVSRAVARHGGVVWAEAAVGKGATFFFTLPR